MSTSKFKDSIGTWLTQSLFIDKVSDTSRRHAIYTLRPEDHEYRGKTYPSLRRLYLETRDPTEYTVATEHLGGWVHWQRLLGNKAIREHIDEWRLELEILLRSEALRAMRQTAINDGSKGTAAAKYLAEKGWDKRPGRPSSAEVERQKKIHAGIHQELEDDAKRMGIRH